MRECAIEKIASRGEIGRARGGSTAVCSCHAPGHLLAFVRFAAAVDEEPHQRAMLRRRAPHGPRLHLGRQRIRAEAQLQLVDEILVTCLIREHAVLYTRRAGLVRMSGVAAAAVR